MRNYVSLLQDLLLSPGHELFGILLKYDLTKNDFPILTSRRVDFDDLEPPSSTNKMHFFGNHLIVFIPTIDALDTLPLGISMCAKYFYEVNERPQELVILIGRTYFFKEDAPLVEKILTKWPKLPPKIQRHPKTGALSLVGYNPHEL